MALIGLVGLVLAQDYRFPTSEADYGNFYPTAYKDHGGSTDWACGGLTYSGHRGSDFGGGSWTGMDAGQDIVAAAAGVVTATNDGEHDRCSTGDCAGGGGFGNYVMLQHANGRTTLYAHLKQWSVQVATGQTVLCGQLLGQMGSSGYSTGPHLHFEVRESDNSASDPFYGGCAAPPTYWLSQGDYGALPGVVCEATEPCAPVGALQCGDAVGSRNDAAGSTDTHGIYGCVEYVYSGPELAWRFATDREEPVTLRLSGLSGDLDLFVLGSAACDGSGCVSASSSEESSDETLTFTAAAGVEYTVVVDGWEGAVSDFVLDVACSGQWPGGDPGGDSAPTDSASGEPQPDTDDRDLNTGAPQPPGHPGARVRRDALGCGVGPGGGGWGLVLAAVWAGVGRRRVRGSGTPG